MIMVRIRTSSKLVWLSNWVETFLCIGIVSKNWIQFFTSILAAPSTIRQLFLLCTFPDCTVETAVKNSTGYSLAAIAIVNVIVSEVHAILSGADFCNRFPHGSLACFISFQSCQQDGAGVAYQTTKSHHNRLGFWVFNVKSNRLYLRLYWTIRFGNFGKLSVQIEWKRCLSFDDGHLSLL